MAYAAASDVAAYCQNILNGDNNFSLSSSPTLLEVNGWLSSGCAILETYLSSKSISVPIANGTRLYAWLTDLNALYGAARVELSRTNVTLGPGERTRGQVFDDMFWKRLASLEDMDLSGVGGTQRSVAPIYVGGISVDDKETRDSDTDRVVPRFRRGQFEYEGTVRPDTIAAS